LLGEHEQIKYTSLLPKVMRSIWDKEREQHFNFICFGWDANEEVNDRGKKGLIVLTLIRLSFGSHSLLCNFFSFPTPTHTHTQTKLSELLARMIDCVFVTSWGTITSLTDFLLPPWS
jgi:hypothetical protein